MRRTHLLGDWGQAVAAARGLAGCDVDAAVGYCRHARSASVSPPWSVAATADGSVVFEWDRPGECVFRLTVTAPGAGTLTTTRPGGTPPEVRAITWLC